MQQLRRNTAANFVRLYGKISGFYVATVLVVLAAATQPALGAGFKLLLLGAAIGIGALHELGHAGTAHGLGMPVVQCLVFPGYGRTRITGTRDRDGGFLFVALAGPLVGAAASLALVRAASCGAMAADFSPSSLGWLRLLGWTALADSAFNLLPFWALDGALVARRWRRLQEKGAIARAQRRVTSAVRQTVTSPVAVAAAVRTSASSPARPRESQPQVTLRSLLEGSDRRRLGVPYCPSRRASVHATAPVREALAAALSER
jgi:Zn-dependent protease